jgi:hypothetical protein
MPGRSQRIFKRKCKNLAKHCQITAHKKSEKREDRKKRRQKKLRILRISAKQR